MNDLVVGIDVGTTKVCTIVGEVRPDEIFVVGLGIEPSRGLRKGAVTDIAQLSGSISASVHKAEKSSGYDISRAFVSVAGSHTVSLTSRGSIGSPPFVARTNTTNAAIPSAPMVRNLRSRELCVFIVSSDI